MCSSARTSNCASPGARSKSSTAIAAWPVTPAARCAAATPRCPPQRLIGWAGNIGTATQTVVAHILATKPHPEQGYRACLGMLALARKYGEARLEPACARAVQLGAHSRKSVDSILARGLDRQPLQRSLDEARPFPAHANVRGPHYYH
jgi:transposase